MVATRTTLLILALALMAIAVMAAPAMAQTYTYGPLPNGIASATADGTNLAPNAKTTTLNPKPVIAGRVTNGATSVTVRVGSTIMNVNPNSSGSFSVTVTTALAPGEYQVSFLGSVVGTLVVSAATPVAPRTGTGPTDTSGNGFGLPLLPIVAGLAAVSVIGYYALRQRNAVS